MLPTTSANSVLPQTAALFPSVDTSTSNIPNERVVEIVLSDGSRMDLCKLNTIQLCELQVQQEPAFAKQIVASRKGSLQRANLVRQAYESICCILEEISRRQNHAQSLSMGMDHRYTSFVLEQLSRLSQSGLNGGIFELGFGSGILLSAAAAQGHRVGGLEVASQLFESARLKLPNQYHDNLWLGDFQSMHINAHRGSYSLVYWNDVFEHIPVDEIVDYLERIHELLAPGGKLITITPNWHMRPSDVTDMFMPPRSDAIGFHLKEYTLREVRDLLYQVGFARVHSPSLISRKRIYMSEWYDLTGLKVACEPLLEKLPYQWAVQACRRFGFNCTVATKLA